MIQTLRSNVAGALAALTLALGLVLVAAAPSQAQVPELPELPPLQEGLVNVNVSDVVVQLPIAVAANVCEVAVNVLAEQIRDGEAATCDAVAESGATVPWNDGNRQGNGQQRGLVNVNVSDIIVQVPISVAANVCEVAVNVLARQDRSGDAAVCDAQAYAPAEVA
ncbi:hypothetical protein [Nitriliruptor alkaliphilus]|uniref:hypothetical protein n=1 Tax=Nitriliruptor alkaliphilus TaxID=427918 RepID=UPI0006963710|nr:hypothetical protein [Nitriliruptor alkaliphilus]